MKTESSLKVGNQKRGEDAVESRGVSNLRPSWRPLVGKKKPSKGKSVVAVG